MGVQAPPKSSTDWSLAWTKPDINSIQIWKLEKEPLLVLRHAVLNKPNCKCAMSFDLLFLSARGNHLWPTSKYCHLALHLSVHLLSMLSSSCQHKFLLIFHCIYVITISSGHCTIPLVIKLLVQLMMQMLRFSDW